MSEHIDSLMLQPSSHLIVVDDFLPSPVAASMRRAIDDHFATPDRHHPETHQLWNYWYVPGLYTYLRTQPEKIISRELVHALMTTLENWARDNLGMDRLAWPYLSMYINGCRQGLHNDSENGRFGWVYSLTNDQRRTVGGETLVLRLDDYAARIHRAGGGTNLYDLVVPKFNRLVVFDDRVPHGVQLLEGSYDPADARFVIHGHIKASGPRFLGGISQAAAQVAINTLNEALAPFQSGQAGSWHGPLCLRAKIRPDGSVNEVIRQVDRVMPIDGHRDDSRTPVRRALEAVQQLKFPPMQTEGELWLPIQFGQQLPG
jgi:hypothetical protein